MNPCPACGTLNVSGTIACMRCGTPLVDASKAPAAAANEPPAQGGFGPPASSDLVAPASASPEPAAAPPSAPAESPSAGAGWGAPPPADAGGFGAGGGGPGWGSPPPSGGGGAGWGSPPPSGYAASPAGGPYAAPVGAAPGAPKPTLDVGDAIKTAFDACTSNFKTLFVVQILCAAPGWLVQTVGQVLQSYSTSEMMASPGTAPNAGLAMAGGAVSLLGMIIYMIGGLIAAGAVSRAVLDALARRTVSDSSTLISYGVSKMGSVFVGSLLTGIAVFVGIFMCCLPGIAAAVLFVMTVPIIIAEDKNGPDAMQRSFDLSEGSRVEIFLTLLAYAAVAFVIAIPMFCVGGGVTAAATVGAGAAIGAAIGSQVMSLFFGAVYGMLQTALEVAIYTRLSGYGSQTNAAEVAKVFG